MNKLIRLITTTKSITTSIKSRSLSSTAISQKSKSMPIEPTEERINDLKESFSIIHNEVIQASLDRSESNKVRNLFYFFWSSLEVVLIKFCALNSLD